MLPIVIGVAFPGKCGDGCTGREILEFGYRVRDVLIRLDVHVLWLHLPQLLRLGGDVAG